MSPSSLVSSGLLSPLLSLHFRHSGLLNTLFFSTLFPLYVATFQKKKEKEKKTCEVIIKRHAPLRMVTAFCPGL